MYFVLYNFLIESKEFYTILFSGLEEGVKVAWLHRGRSQVQVQLLTGKGKFTSFLRITDQFARTTGLHANMRIFLFHTKYERISGYIPLCPYLRAIYVLY